RPAQQLASLPLITTAGTERIPSVLARFATSMLFMSCTITSQDGHAARLINSVVSVHVAHPALNTSIFRLSAMFFHRISRDAERLTLGGNSKVKNQIRILGPSPVCPLRVRSRHFAVQLACPLYLRKRTCAVQTGMSALGHKRTLRVSLILSLKH